MPLRWEDIKAFGNSQNNAFEELVCQLARAEDINGKKEFYRVAAPDGGVEAYCVLENGDEYGWQAKYFLSSIGISQWQQIKKSFETALTTHQNLKKYFVCIPLDRQDPRQPNKKWFMDKWNEKVLEWKKYASTQGRVVEFEYWGSSELIYRLSLEKHAGRKLFWFSQEDFSDKWFESHVETSIRNLGNRYTPELNVELEIAKNFDAISKNDAFRENVKEYFHKFLLSVKKTSSGLRDYSVTDETNIKQINDSIRNIELAFSLSQKKELIQIDINSLEKDIEIIEKILSKSYEYVHANQKDNEGNESASYIKHKINESLKVINEFSNFIQSKILKLANYPMLVLTGQAGTGKSHLLADVASNRIKEKKSCLLLLGQHFTSDESPWTQILRNLLRLNCNENEFLGALSAKAEAQGERLLFFIDAINEGRGKYSWPNHVNGFISEFSKYPWIGLVLSVRSSYEKLLIPDDLISQYGIARIEHLGFDGLEYRASSFFFSQYCIEQPSIPLLHPEFSNPLFLKLFCEGLKRSGLTKIPKGYGGISTIVNFFIKSIDDKLSKPSAFDYPSDRNVISKIIDELIKCKLENTLSFIPYEEAFSIADQALSKFSNKRRFLDALISEGILSKNIFWIKDDEYEEGVYFAYERFEDHLTTSYMLEQNLEGTTLETLFRKNGKLYRYIDDSYISQGILESLSIQIPERTGKELYELLEEKQEGYINVIESFINSLIWRKPETIKENTKEYVNNYVLRNEHTFDLFFQMVYTVSTDPDHPYNADRLHHYLMKFSMSDRDEFWTTYLHDQYYQETAIFRLIDWARFEEDKSYLSNTSRLLAAKALAWLFTSTNIILRDSATEALIDLLENNISTIAELLLAFKSINDPYVLERIFAASYGAVLRSSKLEELKNLSEYIVETIFAEKEVYPNVLVRDYARNIVEYAQYKECIFLEDMTIVRPPYKSFCPSSFPNNEEIDAYKYDYNSDKFKDHYWGQNAILKSMVTEYGRGICGYGDFGRYIFESAVDSWEDFDPNDLSNYACKLIFENYGYDVEKHGKFDRYAWKGDRNENKKERIGKKYQWIALYEILARISDNHKMIDESTRCGEDKQYVWYQGPWNPFVRNIDPTFISGRKIKKLQFLEDLPTYKDWNYTHEKWLISNLELPRPENLITIKDSYNTEWLILDKHLQWEEPVPIGQDKYEHPYKHLWYQIRSYFVKEKEAESLIKWVKDQYVRGDSFPNRRNRYEIFTREYYWSPAYKAFESSYYGGEEWQEVYNRKERSKVIARVTPTSESYVWETGSNSLRPPSHLVPCKLMFFGMKLKYSRNVGEWLDEYDQIVCFDSSIGDEGDSSDLIVNKKYLEDFLKRNKLKIIWTCSGDKNIYGTSFAGKGYPKWLELSGIYTLNRGRVVGEIRPIIRNA